MIKDLTVKRVENGDSNVAGIFHFSNTEMYTKYTMCGKYLFSFFCNLLQTLHDSTDKSFILKISAVFAKLLNLSIDHLNPQDSIPVSAAASRPKDSHLSNKRLEEFNIDTANVPFEQWWTTYLTANQ